MVVPQMELPHFWVSASSKAQLRSSSRSKGNITFEIEIPYALPPGRFEDPTPLPKSFKYEKKEYVYETKCTKSFTISVGGCPE